MLKYEVGKAFPLANQTGAETCRAHIVGSSFDVLYYIDRPTSKEKTVFKDWLRLHVYIEKHVPFMAVSYPGRSWTYDFTLTVVGRSEDILTSFFGAGNAVSLFLIDAKTNILHAARMIGLPSDVEQQIKSACREQLKAYRTISEVDAVIAEVYRRMNTNDIIDAGITYEFVR